jgi:hypothetical protein
MTMTVTQNRADRELVDATVRYSNGLFQFLIGLLPAQVDFLKSRDEQEVREIAESRRALYMPSLKGAA